MGAAANSGVRLGRTVPIDHVAMQGLVISESTTVFALTVNLSAAVVGACHKPARRPHFWIPCLIDVFSRGNVIRLSTVEQP